MMAADAPAQQAGSLARIAQICAESLADPPQIHGKR